MSDSVLQAKGNSIYQDTSTDLSAAIGKLVTFAAGVPAVSASATVPAAGIVLDARTRTVAGTTTYQNSIAITATLPGPVRALVSATSAALAFGDSVMQAADGTLTKDVGPGTARVVVGFCSDKNGAVAGDLAEFTLSMGDIRA